MNQDTIIGFFSGGLIVSVVTHFLSTSRDARNRREDFRGFLGRWLGATRQATLHDVPKTYMAHVEHLWGYYGKLHKDFFHKRRFKGLCDDIGSLKSEDIQRDAGNYREIIARKIEALIDFV
jgi:hypothetical protein